MANTYSTDITASVRLSGTHKRVSASNTTTQPVDASYSQVFSSTGSVTADSWIELSWGSAAGCDYQAPVANDVISVGMDGTTTDTYLAPNIKSAFKTNLSATKVKAIYIKNTTDGAIELTVTPATTPFANAAFMTASGATPGDIKLLVPANGVLFIDNPTGWTVTSSYDLFKMKVLGSANTLIELKMLINNS